MPSFTTVLALVTVLTSITLTSAHPGHAPEIRSAEEQSAHTKRTLGASKCASQAKAMREKRKLARRSFTNSQRLANANNNANNANNAPNRQGKANSSRPPKQGGNGTSAAAAATAVATTINAISSPEHAQELQNTTCVLAPETTEGPYYIQNELVRSDLREDQPGINLILDIGLLDINTCEPLSNAFVEIWACNTTGAYAGYTSASLGTPGGDGSTPPTGADNSTAPPTGDNSTAPSGGAGGEPSSTNLTDNFSWLRGGMATTPEGIVELTTIYPGWYTGRTVHVHTMVHTNYSMQSNGTLLSAQGSVIHIGQIFFDDDLTTEIGALSPYNTTTQERTTNLDDSIFLGENSAGNNALAEHSLLGDSLEDGILSYITIGVDTTASYEITNTNTQSK